MSRTMDNGASLPLVATTPTHIYRCIMHGKTFRDQNILTKNVYSLIDSNININTIFYFLFHSNK